MSADETHMPATAPIAVPGQMALMRDYGDRASPGDGMQRRIAFINPFGTAEYDELIRETIVPYAAEGTTVSVFHLEDAPPNIDYFWAKHIIEGKVFEKIIQVEQEGYHAVISGCCYDPGVRVARELVEIPVVGPMEATLNMVGYFGHGFTLVTDVRKAVPYHEDTMRVHGTQNCRGVRAIDWTVEQMIRDPVGLARDAVEACLRAVDEDGSEVAVLACTIIAGCVEKISLEQGLYRDLPLVNPNLLALKTAESLADLYVRDKYHISRRGFYMKHSQWNPEEFADIRRRYRVVDRDSGAAVLHGTDPTV
jgi:allantoin racemase